MQLFTADATIFKVHMFWEGHKILRNLHLLSYVVPVKSEVKISQNFVAFSEYMNFNSNVRNFSKSQKVKKIKNIQESNLETLIQLPIT